MKIAILGYGKMGRIIEQFATERGHEIVLKINIDNTEDLTLANLGKADVATFQQLTTHITIIFLLTLL